MYWCRISVVMQQNAQRNIFCHSFLIWVYNTYPHRPSPRRPSSGLRWPSRRPGRSAGRHSRRPAWRGPSTFPRRWRFPRRRPTPAAWSLRPHSWPSWPSFPHPAWLR
uniref:(northern house mosquito) hypothetical protein n=1 Tax=Culex pipiens TaxID=7175 RepID=A0A8D8B3Z6_CULPI